MESQQRVLVFSAHAADFCSRAGGTLVKLARRGAKVRVVGATFGERGESPLYWQSHPTASIEEVKAVRKREVEAAAAVLGADARFLDWDDNPLFVDERRTMQLVDAIREFRPTLALTHWHNEPMDPDHGVIAQAAMRAISIAGIAHQTTAYPSCPRPALYFFEATIQLTEFVGFNPDTYVDITDTFEQKQAAMQELAAQAYLIPWYVAVAERRGLQAASIAGGQIKYAEAFNRYLPRVADILD